MHHISCADSRTCRSQLQMFSSGCWMCRPVYDAYGLHPPGIAGERKSVWHSKLKKQAAARKSERGGALLTRKAVVHPSCHLLCLLTLQGAMVDVTAACWMDDWLGPCTCVCVLLDTHTHFTLQQYVLQLLGHAGCKLMSPTRASQRCEWSRQWSVSLNVTPSSSCLSSIAASPLTSLCTA